MPADAHEVWRGEVGGALHRVVLWPGSGWHQVERVWPRRCEVVGSFRRGARGEVAIDVSGSRGARHAKRRATVQAVAAAWFDDEARRG